MTGLGLTEGQGLYFFSAAENQALLAEAGFQARVVRLETWLPYPHVLFVAQPAGTRHERRDRAVGRHPGLQRGRGHRRHDRPRVGLPGGERLARAARRGRRQPRRYPRLSSRRSPPTTRTCASCATPATAARATPSATACCTRAASTCCSPTPTWSTRSRALTPFLAALRQGADVAIGSRSHVGTLFALHPRHFSYIYQRYLVGRAFIWTCEPAAPPGRERHAVRLQDVPRRGGPRRLRPPAARGLRLRRRSAVYCSPAWLPHRRAAGLLLYLGEQSSVELVADSLRMLRDLWRIRRNGRAGLYTRDVPTAEAEARPRLGTSRS